MPSKPRAARIAQLQAAVQRANSVQGRIVRVRRIRQYARRGTKCYIQDLHGGTEAAWFKFGWPRKKEILVVQGGHGAGDHHGEWVFYVNHVYEALPPTLWRYRRRIPRPRI